MATRMKQRRGTAAQWISTNSGQGPILEAGEIGYESDTNKFKIGDGTNHWLALPYFLDEESLGGSLGDYLTVDDLGQPLKAASLDADGKLEVTQLPASVPTSSDITTAVNNAVSSLVDGAPELLDTLNELAAAIGDDPLFFTTIATDLSDHTSATTNVHGILDTNELATKDYVTTQIGNSTVDQSALAGVGIDWNGSTEAFDIDSTVATKTYADGKASDADTSARGYADSLSTNYDAAGDADAAEASAKTYTDNLVGDPTIDGTAGNTVKDRIDSAVSNLVDSAPALLDTLNELAAAIGDDENFITTITGQIGEKVDKSGDTMTGVLILSADPATNLEAATKQYVDSAAGTAQDNAEAYAAGLAVNYDAAGSADTAEENANDYTDVAISTEVTNRNSAISSAINLLTTSDIEEGTNEYFTNERAQDAVGNSLGTGLSYDDATGAVSVTPNTYDAYGAASTVAGDLSTHINDTTAHGTTGDVVGTTDTQTLTNKTFTSPKINEDVALTATATELNTLDGITASTAELNILDGATLSTTELNYVDGVTSAIQDQLNDLGTDKADLASPTFTGTITLPQGKITGGTTTVSANTATTVSTVALNAFTTMEYTVSIKQGLKVRSSKVLVQTDGTSVDSVEHSILEMGGAIAGINVTALVSSTDCILTVTVIDAASTNATVKVINTIV